MRIAICDDEKLFLDNTGTLVKKWAENNCLSVDVVTFTNGDDLLRAHETEFIDLIILDVIMPLLNGIDTAKELRIKDPDVPVIFLTSSREFAVDSYDVGAFYYLIKPVDEEKLFRILDRFYSIYNKKEAFTAKTSSGFRKINVSEVFYLEAQNKLVKMVFHDRSSILIHELFSVCEDYFSLEKGFFKCHRSYIVNLDYVAQFTKTEISVGAVSIPISRNRYHEFKDAYFAHMFKK